MTNLVKLIHARRASKQKIMQNPTLVAMLDWQLHDLKKADAAVEVQKKARPVKQEPRSEEMSPVPRKGMDSAAPIAVSLCRACAGLVRLESRWKVRTKGCPKCAIRLSNLDGKAIERHARNK
jgi:hypothetical protein